MSKQQNLETQKKMGEAVNKGDLEVLRDIFTASVLDHDPAPDQAKGPEGFIHFFQGMKTAFPDLAIAVDQMVLDEDNIAIAYTASGTHKGDFRGTLANGKKVKFRGVQIARFENGRIVERWGSSDELGLLRQLGAVTAVHSITEVTASK